MDTKEIKWKDIKIGDVFEDGSEVNQIHPIHKANCYKLSYVNRFKSFAKMLSNRIEKEITLSEDHLILCNVRHLREDTLNELRSFLQGKKIPTKVDYEIVMDEDVDNGTKIGMIKYLTGIVDATEGDKLITLDSSSDTQYNSSDSELAKMLEFAVTKETVVESHDAIQENGDMWLSAEIIHFLVNTGEKILSDDSLIFSSVYVGEKDAMCVSTDTGKYEVNDLIHHNSVTLRNIIFHALTHNHDIAIGLVDMKLTEFTQFKGINGVVGVANSVQETVELLRISKQVMYKRNREMAKLGITDIIDFKPQKPTDQIWIAGREFQEDTIMKIKIDGEEKEMSAKEILEYVQNI